MRRRIASGSASSSATSSSTIRIRAWFIGSGSSRARRRRRRATRSIEGRAASGRPRERDLAAVLLDDAVRDREPEPGARPDLLRREERVEDALGDPRRDPGPGVREDDPDPVAIERRDDPDLLRSCGTSSSASRAFVEQVDEDLLELDRVAEDDELVRAEVEVDLDRAQPELLLHQRQRALDHLVDVDGLERHRRRAAERAQVGDDLRRLPHLLHRLVEVLERGLRVELAHVDPVDHVADVEADVVQRVVQLVRDAGRQLAERGQLAGLDELLLLVAQLLLAALHLLRRRTQVAHDVDHRLAAVLELEVRLVRVLEDVQHRLALVAEPLVRLVEVAHDVNQRPAPFLGLADAELKLFDLLFEGRSLAAAALCLRLRSHFSRRRRP